MTFDAEALKQQIPYYLAAEPEQKAFVRELKALSEGSNDGFYLNQHSDPYGDTMLQGDGWPGFLIISFNSGDRLSVRGIVLSNSCDVSPDNSRTLPTKLIFAPIIRLSAFSARCQEQGLSPEQVETKIEAIRTQSVTSIFYLPAGGSLDEEYVALLDEVHSMPVEAHGKDEKLFTLSMAGFYLFIFKLSVHFCRLRENVNRTPRATPP